MNKLQMTIILEHMRTIVLEVVSLLFYSFVTRHLLLPLFAHDLPLLRVMKE